MSSTAEAGTEGAVRPPSVRRAQPLAAYLARFAAGILAPVLLITGYLLTDAAGRERADALHDAAILLFTGAALRLVGQVMEHLPSYPDTVWFHLGGLVLETCRTWVSSARHPLY